MTEIFSDPNNPDASTAAAKAMLEAFADGVGHSMGNTNIALVAQREGRSVGLAGGPIIFGWAFLRYLVVEPQARGQGIGRDLLYAFEDEARRAGAHAATTDSYGFMAAAFYRKYGYEELGALHAADPVETRHYFVKRL